MNLANYMFDLKANILIQFCDFEEQNVQPFVVSFLNFKIWFLVFGTH